MGDPHQQQAQPARRPMHPVLSGSPRELGQHMVTRRPGQHNLSEVCPCSKGSRPVGRHDWGGFCVRAGTSCIFKDKMGHALGTPRGFSDQAGVENWTWRGCAEGRGVAESQRGCWVPGTQTRAKETRWAGWQVVELGVSSTSDGEAATKDPAILSPGAHPGQTEARVYREAHTRTSTAAGPTAAERREQYKRPSMEDGHRPHPSTRGSIAQP